MCERSSTPARRRSTELSTRSVTRRSSRTGAKPAAVLSQPEGQIAAFCSENTRHSPDVVRCDGGCAGLRRHVPPQEAVWDHDQGLSRLKCMKTHGGAPLTSAKLAAHFGSDSLPAPHAPSSPIHRSRKPPLNLRCPLRSVPAAYQIDSRVAVIGMHSSFTPRRNQQPHNLHPADGRSGG